MNSLNVRSLPGDGAAGPKRRFARPYLQLMRAPALFTAVSNVAAAHLIATSGAVEWLTLGLLAAASVALLAGGMVLNDCFDVEVDRRERPQRPLPSGRVPLKTAWLLGAGLLALGVLAASCTGQRAALIATSLAAAILLYDGVVKEGWLGPPLMGLCRYLNWMLGLSVAATGWVAWAVPLPVFAYICGVTLLSRAEVDARNRSLVAAAIGAMLVAALTIVALWWWGVLGNPWVLPLVAGASIVVVRGLVRLYRDFSPAAVQTNMTALIVGVIGLDAVLAIGAGQWWGALLLLLVVPSRWLGRRLYIT